MQYEFDRGIAELAAYVHANGSARVLQKYRAPAGFKLGSWCSERRKQRKAGQLSDDRAAELDALGFVWDPLQADFDAGLAELAAYVDAKADARVPDGYRTTTGFNLGAWCSSRRNDRRLGRLSPERIDALQAIPGWTWSVKRRR